MGLPALVLRAGMSLLGAGGAPAKAAARTAARGGAPAKAAAAPGGAPNVRVSGRGNVVHVHTAPPAGAPHKESVVDRAWKYDSAVALFERIADKLSSLTATGVHTIQVTAVGGPLADLRRVWYLCVAAAFGRYRNRVGATLAVEYSIECTWDVTGKTTMVTLGYVLSGLTGNVGSDGNSTPGSDDLTAFLPPGLGLGLTVAKTVSDGLAAAEGAPPPPPTSSPPAVRTIAGGAAGVVDLIQRGPDQVTIGAGWPTFLRRVPIIGGRSASERNVGKYTPAFDGRSVLSALEEYVKLRFGGAGGPSAPNVLRELPWDAVEDNRPVLRLPVGAVADLFRDANYHTRFEGRSGPYSVLPPGGEGAPLLPDAGRVITTGEKFDPDVQPPKPAIDGISRGSLVELVTLALEQPCNPPVKVAPDDTPLAPKGARVHAPEDEIRGEIRRAALSSVASTAVDIGSAIVLGATEDNEDGRTVPAINQEAE